jgi:hypothetical protein
MEKSSLRVCEEQVVPVGVFDWVDYLDIQLGKRLKDKGQRLKDKGYPSMSQ